MFSGSVLIFQHDIMHEGSELIKGRKYSVRTDVMYTRENNYRAETQTPVLESKKEASETVNDVKLSENSEESAGQSDSENEKS